MNKLNLTHAKVVLPDQILENASVRIEDGTIHSINDHNAVNPDEEVLSLDGAYLMPGIIDIHTDALDAEINPRPGADIPIGIAFAELERKMSGVGFTTVYHSLHLGYNSAELNSRSKYSREEVFKTVSDSFLLPGLLRNKIHLRFELTGIHAYETCFDFINAGYISMLSVMDHTPGQGQFGMEHYVEFLKKMGKTENEAKEKFEEEINKPRIEGEKLRALIQFAQDKGIAVASHDDDTPEKVSLMHSYGVQICEFPINFETAHFAKSLKMDVVGGASNILRGGSLSGNMDMKTAVLNDAVNVLCSDYYPPAILHSIFKLHLDSGMDLSKASNLASLNAAKAAGIQDFTGSIEIGKSADLMVVEMRNGIPFVRETLVQGNLVARSKAKENKEDPWKVLN